MCRYLILYLLSPGGDYIRVLFDPGQQPFKVTVPAVGDVRFDQQLLQFFVKVAVEHAVVQPAEVLYLQAAVGDIA